MWRSGSTASHHCRSPTILCGNNSACSAHSVGATASSLNRTSYHRNSSAMSKRLKRAVEGLELCTRGNTHAQMVLPSTWLLRSPLAVGFERRVMTVTTRTSGRCVYRPTHDDDTHGVMGRRSSKKLFFGDDSAITQGSRK